MTQLVKAVPLTIADVIMFEELDRTGGFVMCEDQQRSCEVLGVSASESLRACVERSVEAHIVAVNDEPAVLWGHAVKTVLANVGGVWMIVLPLALEHRLRFARVSISAVSYLLSIYNRIEVIVDARFLRSIHWLLWLGFQKHETAIDISGLKVVFMWKER